MTYFLLSSWLIRKLALVLRQAEICLSASVKDEIRTLVLSCLDFFFLFSWFEYGNQPIPMAAGSGQ